MVAEDTGSITETQEALGHRNLATTRLCPAHSGQA
jgi:hypothetical protein